MNINRIERTIFTIHSGALSSAYRNCWLTIGVFALGIIGMVFIIGFLYAGYILPAAVIAIGFVFAFLFEIAANARVALEISKAQKAKEEQYKT